MEVKPRVNDMINTINFFILYLIKYYLAMRQHPNMIKPTPIHFRVETSSWKKVMAANMPKT